jgi:ammonium transporter, Amt family
VLVTAYVLAASFAIFKVTDLLTPSRVEEDQEQLGLDISQHGEQLVLPSVTPV